MRLSILDVKCKVLGGETFLVEMQVLPVTGFLNRVVYNACKAYVGTLSQGHAYESLTNVVAVSICDFSLWSDADQDADGAPRVPLVSHWRMTERTAGATALGQVEYLFCELPKLGPREPVTAAERWAAIFVAAPLLTPDDVARIPFTSAQRHALDLAREESYTPEEREAIERRREEVDQVRRAVLAAEVKGEARGRAEGALLAKREVLLRLLASARVQLTPEQSTRVSHCSDAAQMDAWLNAALSDPCRAARACSR
jgi:hypothetical protein